MPSQDERITELERWRKEHDTQHRREHTELRREVSEMIDGVKAFVTKAVASLHDDLKENTLLTREARDELRLATEERIRRRAVEEHEAKRKADIEAAEATALARRQAESKLSHDDIEVKTLANAERNKRLAIIAGVMLAIISLVGTLVGLAANSQHH